MSVTLSIDLPDDLATAARAAAGHRRLEDAVRDWIRQALVVPPVSALPDDQVLALSCAMLPEDDQEALSDLLAGQSDGTLTPEEKAELDIRMSALRVGQVRKSEALVEAVNRGFRPRLDRDSS